MEIFAIVLLSMSVVTWGQYVEPPEIEGHLDDAYQFAYAVASPEHGDYHGHQQTRDENGYTSGSYYLLGADGQWSQTIFADKGLGYQALYNQRPAGAPPPQVSEVTYQVFVHPGATAISAQGGGEGGPPAPPPQLQPFGGIQQKSLTQQIQNNQINQQQNRQSSQRFNRNIRVQDSANQQQFLNPQQFQNPEQFQNSQPRFNRDTQVSNSANLISRPQTVAQEQTPMGFKSVDLDTSASIESNVVVVPAPKNSNLVIPFRSRDPVKSKVIAIPVDTPAPVESNVVIVPAPDNSNIVVPFRPRDPVKSEVIAIPVDTPASVESNVVVVPSPENSSLVVPFRPRDPVKSNAIAIPRDTPAPKNPNLVRVPFAPRPPVRTVYPRGRGVGSTRYGFPPATSIFNEDIGVLLRRFRPPPHAIPRQ